MKYSNKVVIFVLIFSILFSACNKSSPNNLDLKTHSITLYNQLSDGEFVKCITFTDSRKVNKIVKECQNFNFKKSEHEYNLLLTYYLVFDDSGVYIQFADLDTDIGHLGKDFSNVDSLKDFATFNVDIPLKTLKVLKDYVE